MQEPERIKPRDFSRLPTASILRESILEALREMGGEGSNIELERRVADVLGVSAEDLAIPHDPERGARTEFAYRMAWARTHVKQAGLIENIGRKLWALTSRPRAAPEASSTSSIEPS